MKSQNNFSVSELKRDRITCLAESCLSKDSSCFIVTGLISGKVEIRDAQHQQAQCCVLQPKVMVTCKKNSISSYLLQDEMSGAVTSLACRQKGNLVAVGTEKGTITVWGGKNHNQF